MTGQGDSCGQGSFSAENAEGAEIIQEASVLGVPLALLARQGALNLVL